MEEKSALSFKVVVLRLRDTSQSLEQGVSVSRTSWSLSQDKDVLCSVRATRVLQPGFWGFDYILWVLIVTDLACRWLHFIPVKKGPVLPAELGASRPTSVAVCWPPPSWDGEGHVSSSSSPWVVWLSAYLHLSAGASFSLHPSPSSFSVRLLNIPRSAPFTALKQNSSIVYQH